MTVDPDPGRILVVEDDPVNRAILQRGVERLGHVVVAASDGREALAVLRDGAVDLVLLDLLMPEVDGFEVLTAMRADPELDPIPVIVISAVDETEPVARSIELGAVDCLPKPFDPLLLRVRVDTALRQRRLRQLEHDYLRQEVALRQQDKLATLGRLSAGIAHEINNPVSAALRTVAQLDEHLVDASGALADLLGVASATPPPAPRLDARAHAALEQDLEDLLTAADVGEPWMLAGGLATAGLSPADVQDVLDGQEPARATATLRWIVARSAIRRSVDQLGSSLGRIADIVGALRSYTYLDRAPRQAVDVHAGLDDTLTILAHRLPDGVVVERELDPHLPALMAWGSQLNQVWTNLIDNAIDAVGDSGHILLRTRGCGDTVVVEVEDDGPGVPPDLLGQVFDPFVTSKEPGQGTGLGLNISHQIVTEQHGGRLEVESRPGRTVFRVHLPVAGPHEQGT